jgi:UPF0716 protein FxsA
MLLLLALIAIPLIEIALFIQVGGLIGLWPTLLIVIGTAVLGAFLVRSQGISQLRKLQSSFERLENPTESLAHGAMILLSGLLLLAPGFFTDTLGFLLLIPQVRDRVFRFLRSRVRVQSFPMAKAQERYTPREEGVIDGEFYEVDPDSLTPRPGSQPSGWTRT